MFQKDKVAAKGPLRARHRPFTFSTKIYLVSITKTKLYGETFVFSHFCHASQAYEAAQVREHYDRLRQIGELPCGSHAVYTSW